MTTSDEAQVAVERISEGVGSALLGGRDERDGGEGGRQLDVGGCGQERVVVGALLNLVDGQAGLHQSLQSVDEQLHVFGVAIGPEQTFFRIRIKSVKNQFFAHCWLPQPPI